MHKAVKTAVEKWILVLRQSLYVVNRWADVRSSK
jgi:hypothetical protein